MCRSRRELSNAYFLAKFRFDTAENEPSKVCPIEPSAGPPSAAAGAGPRAAEGRAAAAREAVLRHGAELARAEFYSPTGEELDKVVKRLANYHGRRGALLARRRKLP